MDRVDLVSEQRKTMTTRIMNEFLGNRVIKIVKLEKCFRGLKEMQPTVKKSVCWGSMESIRSWRPYEASPTPVGCK